MRNFAIFGKLILMSRQRTYKIEPIKVNGIKISQVVIDSHYEEKHRGYMNDELILILVNELNERHELPDTKIEHFLILLL